MKLASAPQSSAPPWRPGNLGVVSGTLGRPLQKEECNHLASKTSAPSHPSKEAGTQCAEVIDESCSTAGGCWKWARRRLWQASAEEVSGHSQLRQLPGTANCMDKNTAWRGVVSRTSAEIFVWSPGHFPHVSFCPSNGIALQACCQSHQQPKKLMAQHLLLHCRLHCWWLQKTCERWCRNFQKMNLSKMRAHQSHKLQTKC